MKKRLMIGLATGALLAAMAPGVASAAPPQVKNTGQCVAKDIILKAAFYEFGGFADQPGAVAANGVAHVPNGHAPFEISAVVCNVPN